MIIRQLRGAAGRNPVPTLVTVLVVLALAAPASAFGASPATDQYGSRSQQIAATGAGGSSGGGGAPGQTASAGSTASGNSAIGGLPFTGLDLGLMALAAIALLGGGFTLRWLANPARRSS